MTGEHQRRESFFEPTAPTGWAKTWVTLGAAAVAYALLWVWSTNLWALFREHEAAHRAELAMFRDEMKAGRLQEASLRSRSEAMLVEVQRDIAVTLRMTEKTLAVVVELARELRDLKTRPKALELDPDGVTWDAALIAFLDPTSGDFG